MKIITGLSVLSLVFTLNSCAKENELDKELKEAAANMNRLTPQMMNDGIRLDSVTAGSGKTFTYSYTLTEDMQENVTDSEVNAFKKEAKESAVNTIKTSADMQFFKDNDVILKYAYYDKNGKLTADFSVVPAEYKPKK